MDNGQPQKSYMEYLNTALCCLLAFGGSYFILPQNGLLSTLMLIIPIAIACALLKAKWYVKVFSFAGFGFIMSTIYNEGTTANVITGVICGVLIILAMVAVWLFKQKKLLYIMAGAVIIAATAVFHVFALGNPAVAFKSEQIIKDYYKQTYDTEAVTMSGVYYNRKAGVFCADIYGTDNPAEVYTLYAYGDTVNESYKRYAEQSLMAKKRAEIVNSLRKVYPNTSFKVVQKSISAYPEGVISPADTTDYSSRMSFAIYIPSDLTVLQFKERIRTYTLTLCNADINVNDIDFYGGIADKYYRMVNYKLTALPQAYNRIPIFSNMTEEYICRSVFSEF